MKNPLRPNFFGEIFSWLYKLATENGRVDKANGFADVHIEKNLCRAHQAG
jgi:hypothetical protein